MSGNISGNIIAGIEGGATHSNLVLMNAEGAIIGKAKGPGTNHHLLGMEVCWNRINDMMNQAKTDAGIPTDTPILAVGLSLSGCETEETNKDFVDGLKKRYPNISEQYAIGSDTEGSIAATSNKGGVVCIAGTGSNTLLINPDGTRVQCGGWGNLLGDEGSAWNISNRAIKTCFDELDNFLPAPYTITRVWELIQDHFQIKTQADLLVYFYGSKFDKAFIAGLCLKLAELARNGDLLAIHIFEQAGLDLARGIGAVLQKADKVLTNREGGVQIICVGSVWISWDLLKTGFINYLENVPNIDKMTLMRLSSEMGVGAALMAADRLALRLDRDYSKNYKVFFNYEKCTCTNEFK